MIDAMQCNDFINSIVIPQFQQNIRSIYKESVELTFVHLVEGCGKTLIIDRRHNTPHSDRYGVRVRRTRPVTGIYTKVSVVPFRPYDQENFHIFNKGLAKKHFHKYVMPNGQNRVTSQM